MEGRAEWKTVERGVILAPEDVAYMRIIEAYDGYVLLQDGKCYLSDIHPMPGQIVMAHVPWDGFGFITPA